MRSFQKKRKLIDIMQTKSFLIFLGIFILIFIFSMFRFLNKMEETARNKKVIEEKIIELEKSKEKLNLDLSKLKTEKGIDESIREKFGLIKDGENMIMVVDDKNDENADKKLNSQGFFSFIKNWFK